MKYISKYFVLLSRNNPLTLKGLKSVDLKIIQMYHFPLKWKKYTVCINWWDSNFFGVGLPFFPVGLLLFARWKSWTPVFKILVRALVTVMQPILISYSSCFFSFLEGDTRKVSKTLILETSLSWGFSESTCRPVLTSFQVGIEIYEDTQDQSGDRVLSTHITNVSIILRWYLYTLKLNRSSQSIAISVDSKTTD